MKWCRSPLKSVVVLAIAALSAGACQWFNDIVGLAKSSTVPNAQSVDTPDGWPVIVLHTRDSTLTPGDTETLVGEIEIAPVTVYSQPVAVYTDSSRRVVSSDTDVAAVNGTLITARAPGTAKITMMGYYMTFPLNAYLELTVRPAP